MAKKATAGPPCIAVKHIVQFTFDGTSICRPVKFSTRGCLNGLLIYMSIDDEIVNRVSEGRLHEIAPTSGPWLREVFAPTALYEELEGYGEDARIGQLRARLNVFLNEGTVVVGRGRSKRGLMKKLDKCHEVWEFIDKVPPPSLRLFGRFATRNVFVATHVRERRWLLGYNSFRWRREQRRCVATWRQLFPTYDPHEGETIHEYLSNAIPTSAVVRAS